MVQNASTVLLPDLNEVELARSPFSYYGIDEKYVQKKYYKFCANCDKIEQESLTFKICLKCKQLGVEKWEPLYHHYCSKDCQIVHWKIHRIEHIQYEKEKLRQLNLDDSFGSESEEQKAEREDTLPDDPLPERTPGNDSCNEVEILCKTEMDGGVISTALMLDRATSPISENPGIPDKVQFNISAGTSSAKFCLGKKIIKREGCVETSMVDLLKQETTPDGTINATATPVYEEIVIYVKNVWKQQVPMGKNPSKDIEYRGKKKDSATSPPQKGDLGNKGSKKLSNQPKSTRKGGRGSGKMSRTAFKEYETVADVSDVPPSKISSEPFWAPKIHDSRALPAPPSGSAATPAVAPAPPSGSDVTPAEAPPSGSDATPAKALAPPSGSGVTPAEASPSGSDATPVEAPAPPSGSDVTPAEALTPPSCSDITPPEAAAPPSGSDTTPAESASSKHKPDDTKAIMKSKPKKKKDKKVQDVVSLSNKYVTVVDVNECKPLEPKHYETEDSSSGSDVGGYMMYILTDETDGKRSAVVEKRKNKHKRNFNPRILFDKEHVKKKRALPRKDGKPRQDVTFHISHPSDKEESSSEGSSPSSTERKAIASKQSSEKAGTSKTRPKATQTNSTSKCSSFDTKSNENSKSTSKSKEASLKSASQPAAAAKPKNAEVSTKSDAVKMPASGGLRNESKLNSPKKESKNSKFKEQGDSCVKLTAKAMIESARGANKQPDAVSHTSKSLIKVDNDTKPKIDPLPGLHSVCQKINKAFAEEMPRSSRIIEVTESDDEIEQSMFQISNDYIDKLFSGKLEKPKKKKGRKRDGESALKSAKNDSPLLMKSAHVDRKTSSDIARNESPAVETAAAGPEDKSDQKNFGSAKNNITATGSADLNQKESLVASKHEAAIKSVDDKNNETAALRSNKDPNSLEKSGATSEAKSSSSKSNEQASTSVKTRTFAKVLGSEYEIQNARIIDPDSGLEIPISLGLLNTITESLGISEISSRKTPEAKEKRNDNNYNGNNNGNSQSPHTDTLTSSKEVSSKSVSMEMTKSLKHEKTESSSSCPEALISGRAKKSSVSETESKTESNDAVHQKMTKSSLKSTPLDGTTPSNSVTTVSESNVDQSPENVDKKPIVGDSTQEEQAGSGYNLSMMQSSEFWTNDIISRAQEMEDYLADLTCLQGPTINSSMDSIDRKNFVLGNAAYAGQDIDVTIVRTRLNKDHNELADDYYYVSRKIKIAPVTKTKPTKNSENDAPFFKGKGGIIVKPKNDALFCQEAEIASKNTESAKLDGSKLSEKKENSELTNRENPEQNRRVPSSVTTSATSSSKCPIVEYDMHSQLKPPADQDYTSSGKFKVLNSDKEFGDIYSEESISQLSNPSVDVTRIFSPKDEPSNEPLPPDCSSDNAVTTDIPLDGAETVAGPTSLEDGTTSENAVSQKQIVSPNIKTLLLKRGQFGFSIETEGDYRIFTQLYTRKYWIPEEIEDDED